MIEAVEQLEELDHDDSGCEESIAIKDILLSSSLSSRFILILDGGVSTHLKDLNQGQDFPYRELWSSSLLLSSAGREIILRGHKDWIVSGADILSTVTYQCHYEANLWPKRQNYINNNNSNNDQEESKIVITKSIMDEMFQNGIDLARQAIIQEAHHEEETQKAITTNNNDVNNNKKYVRRKPIYIAMSSGCYGAALSNGAEYTGSYGSDITAQDIYNFHSNKLDRIKELHPDIIAFETIPSYLECQALVRLLNDEMTKNNCSNLPACYISLACQNGTQLNDGTLVHDVVSFLLKSIPATILQGIGFNCCDCGYLPNLVTILIQQMIVLPDRRAIVIYPNSGETWDPTTENFIIGTGCTTPYDMAHSIFNVIQTIEYEWSKQSPYCSTSLLPTIIVGGCCRTRPATIAALRQLIDDHMMQTKE